MFTEKIDSKLSGVKVVLILLLLAMSKNVLPTKISKEKVENNVG
jgi:hypothetical protein